MDYRKQQLAGIQKGFFNQAEKKQDTKHSHQTPETPITEEKPKKQQKLLTHQNPDISEFNTDPINMQQMHAMVLDLQKTVKDLKKENLKLKERLESKYELQDRNLSTIWENFNYMLKELRKAQEEAKNQENKIENIQIQATKTEVMMDIEPEENSIQPETMPMRLVPKPRKKCYHCQSRSHLLRSCESFRRWKEIQDRRLWNDISRIYYSEGLCYRKKFVQGRTSYYQVGEKTGEEAPASTKHSPFSQTID